MLKEKKAQVVSDLAEDLSRSAIIITTNYQGMRAKQMTELRQTLAKANIQYRVVKNTLLYRAADKVGKLDLMTVIEGPVALAFGYDDVASVAKVLSQYAKSAVSPMQIRGGLLGDRILKPEEIASLANLPSREVLVSRLIGQLQVPVSGLHNVLQSPLRALVYVLQNKAQMTGR
ncbi:MAG: 50S ribosomal protein L10 [Dehalococcoidia bacterium]